MTKLPKYSTMVLVDPSKEYDLDFNVLKSYKINDVNIKPKNLIKLLKNNKILKLYLLFFGLQSLFV